MEKNLKDIANHWIKKAENDFQAIINEFNSEKPVTDIICFHSQQVVEKYLKLFLVIHKIKPIKTHNIALLLTECERLNEDFKDLQGVEYLSNYAIDLRYPDNFYIPGIEEAKEAFKNAKKVRNFVRKLIVDLKIEQLD